MHDSCCERVAVRRTTWILGFFLVFFLFFCWQWGKNRLIGGTFSETQHCKMCSTSSARLSFFQWWVWERLGLCRYPGRICVLYFHSLPYRCIPFHEPHIMMMVRMVMGSAVNLNPPLSVYNKWIAYYGVNAVPGTVLGVAYFKLLFLQVTAKLTRSNCSYFTETSIIPGFVVVH